MKQYITIECPNRVVRDEMLERVDRDLPVYVSGARPKGSTLLEKNFGKWRGVRQSPAFSQAALNW